MANRKDSNDRDRTGPDRVHRGSRAADEIGKRIEEEAGHPVGGRTARSLDRELPVDTPSGSTIPQQKQHSRKGQAESPRELTHNEPPKHQEGHR